MLKTEFEYYKSHLDELVAKYEHKVIAIVGEEVQGVFDTELDAYQEMKKTYQVGTFLIQKCQPGESSYTQTFHSRVVFS